MLHLCIVLMLVHQAYSLFSVIDGQYGESVTVTCWFPDLEHSNTRVKWYKQSVGDTLTLITSLMKNTVDPVFEPGFSPSRFGVNCTTVMSTLTIFKTEPEDEALYHCAVLTWRIDRWTRTYLSLKENGERTTKYTVAQWPTISDPVHPGDSVTLQCSVLPDSQKSSCPDEHSVHWFGVRSDKSLGNIIYSNGNGPHERDGKPDIPSPSKSCVYHFSKNVSSSDTGIYYCALVTCGEIIFGNGIKLDIEAGSRWSFGVFQMNSIILLLLSAVLVICALVIAILIFILKKTKCDSCNVAVFLQKSVGKRNVKSEEDRRIYSAAFFTVIKPGSGGRRDAQAGEKQRIYAAVKAFGLD
ncbi:uncharacterized protein LOC142397382 [Odontesthes bonariensis]|uniref:uncharacterized protein LOC142397382 n=1 Tax=Odontesthes bonariensis TaxID=219752 RepID=UPI003F585257